MGRLEGMVTLVSGAAAGIGEGIARAFVREGAVVVLSDTRDEEGEQLAGMLGNRAVYRRLDVSQEPDWKSVTTTVLKQFGRLDVVVNNAGITGLEASSAGHDPEHTSLEDWRALLATNAGWDVPGLQVCDPGDEEPGNRFDHQYIFTVGNGGSSRCRGLCSEQGCGAQSFEVGGSLLRRTGMEYPLQFNSSSGHTDAHVGADAGEWSGP